MEVAVRCLKKRFSYPLNKEKTPIFDRKLMGFKGTYFIFEAAVFNPPKSFTPNSVDGGNPGPPGMHFKLVTWSAKLNWSADISESTEVHPKRCWGFTLVSMQSWELRCWMVVLYYYLIVCDVCVWVIYISFWFMIIFNKYMFTYIYIFYVYVNRYSAHLYAHMFWCIHYTHVFLLTAFYNMQHVFQL